MGNKLKNPRRIFSQDGLYESSNSRITNLENNEYKVTYYEIISGTSGSLTLPTGATINAGEFGLSGNCILSKIDGSDKPIFESPKTSDGAIVTASLNETDGSWVTSGTYTDTDVALIYSIKIKAVYYSNLTYANIIETVELNDNQGFLAVLTSTSISTTSSGNTDLTEMNTPVLANTKYAIDGIIRIGCNNTGGVALQLTLPSGSVFIALNGPTTNSTTAQWLNITTSATLAGSYCRINTSTGFIYIKGTVEIGATAGNLVWGFASVVNLQTSTVYRVGTQIKITKI